MLGADRRHGIAAGIAAVSHLRAQERLAAPRPEPEGVAPQLERRFHHSPHGIGWLWKTKRLDEFVIHEGMDATLDERPGPAGEPTLEQIARRSADALIWLRVAVVLGLVVVAELLKLRQRGRNAL